MHVNFLNHFYYRDISRVAFIKCFYAGFCVYGYSQILEEVTLYLVLSLSYDVAWSPRLRFSQIYTVSCRFTILYLPIISYLYF